MATLAARAAPAPTSKLSRIPQAVHIDSTLALLRGPYHFIREQCRRRDAVGSC